MNYSLIILEEIEIIKKELDNINNNISNLNDTYIEKK